MAFTPALSATRTGDAAPDGAAQQMAAGRRFPALAIVLLCSVLGACGFQLRGAYALPFETLNIALPETSELRAVLKRNIEASSQTRIVDDPKMAQAILTITSDVPAKNVLSLSSAGRVREYQLVRAVSFRLQDRPGHDLMAPGQIVIRRDISFSDPQVLAKESEESLLWRDMQNDLVQQIVRRMASAGPRAAASQ